MSLKYRIIRDFVLGLCFILDGLRLMLLPGVFTRVRGLALPWSAWITKRWIQHLKKLKGLKP